jgi:multidrug efflux system outer membrane protein
MCTLIFSCAVGPDYRRPPIDAAKVFRGPDGGAQASFADLPWWEVFNDTRLKDLIKTALTNNYDLRATASRIEQARALAAQTRAQFFPQLGYDGEITRGKNSFFNRAAPSGGRISDSALGLLSIAWELDLWGRIRRADEAARAQLFAAGEARRGVMLSLVSDVAQAYFELLELDLQLEIAKRTTKSFDDTLRIFRERLEGGVASKLETARAEASLATAASSVPDLERVIVIKENQINFLLSRDPGPIPRAAVLLDQRVPPDIPAGLPSILLERRPDVRQAEQELVAANAQIGVAVADFFPKIGLTTFFGRASAALSDFSSGKRSDFSRRAARWPVRPGRSAVARSATALSTNRAQCLSRSVERVDLASKAGRNPNPTSARGRCADQGRAVFHSTLCRRAIELFRSVGSSTTTLSRGKCSGPDPTQSIAGGRPALQGSRRQLEPGR